MATGMKNNSNDSNRQGQGGSGSAENIGQPREAQKAQMTHVDEQQKKDIAEQTGLKPDDILGLDETGATSGRDDFAGGSGDDMESTDSDAGTDKFS
jgi:hypothetical protein